MDSVGFVKILALMEMAIQYNKKTGNQVRFPVFLTFYRKVVV